MTLFYFAFSVSFFVLLIINLVWIVGNVYLWAVNGLQSILQGFNFVEGIFASTQLKWIILADLIWLSIAISWSIRRKHFRTKGEINYLKYDKINEPSICVVIAAYNEKFAIESVVKDFIGAQNVNQVIVVDNNSSDGTPDIAEKCGAKVIRKDRNMGFAHSFVIGMIESLKTNCNIIVLVEGEGTCNAYDLSRMIPYLDNCDMAVGTRQIQVLSEKGNQIKMVYVWGNYFLAKAIQFKFFSLLHMGVVNLTDVGCIYRAIRKESLEKIIHEFTKPDSKEVIPGEEFTLFMTIKALRNNLKLVEIPISFKKRVGISKTGSDKKLRAIVIGLKFLWFILRS